MGDEIECPDIAVVPLDRAPCHDSGASQQCKVDRSPVKKLVRNTSFESALIRRDNWGEREDLFRKRPSNRVACLA